MIRIMQATLQRIKYADTLKVKVRSASYLEILKLRKGQQPMTLQMLK